MSATSSSSVVTTPASTPSVPVPSGGTVASSPSVLTPGDPPAGIAMEALLATIGGAVKTQVASAMAAYLGSSSRGPTSSSGESVMCASTL